VNHNGVNPTLVSPAAKWALYYFLGCSFVSPLKSRKTRVESSSGSSGTIFHRDLRALPTQRESAGGGAHPDVHPRGIDSKGQSHLARSFVGIVLARARSVDSTRSWTRRLGRFARAGLRISLHDPRCALGKAARERSDPLPSGARGHRDRLGGRAPGARRGDGQPGRVPPAGRTFCSV
jgi:hypothetical protein